MKKIEFNFENVGGLAEIYAIPPADLLRLRHDYVGDTYNVELRTRDNIIVIPVFGDRSFVFSEEKGQVDGGDYWDVSIEGVIPSVNGKNQKLIEDLDRGEWLVVFKDNNGTVFLSGSVDVPLVFSGSKTSGDAYASLNGIEFSFTAKQPSPSVILDIDSLDNI